MVDIFEGTIVGAYSHIHINPHLTYTPLYLSPTKTKTIRTPKLNSIITNSSSSSSTCFSRSQDRTSGGKLLSHKFEEEGTTSKDKKGTNFDDNKKRRVFFLDVNPLCYKGSTPSLHSFAHWLSIFFSQVSRTHPVIAVIDGEGGNEYRRQLLPSYKAHRRKFSPQLSAQKRFLRNPVERSHQLVLDVLQKCNVPVLKVEAYEADDVVATLVEQVLIEGYRVVIASPDKDFKQLISEDVQIVMPMPELGRWSFYTLKHYIAQYQCDPRSDLSLRCILGDEVDGVPGIQHVIPSFGRKTALKLLKKPGSLENLLNAAAVRTVGRQYAQDALVKYADYLRRNYEVLSLRRDANVHIQEEWLSERDMENDAAILSNFVKLLGETQNPNQQNRSHSNDKLPSVCALEF